MFKSAIAKSIPAAALVAIVAVFLTSVVPEPKARPQDALPPLAKGDRLPVPVKGAACSSRGWPHYEQSCQFDMRRPAGEVRTIRIVALR
jgi:hypothetical protein